VCRRWLTTEGTVWQISQAVLGFVETLLHLFCYVVSPCSKHYQQTSSEVSKEAMVLANNVDLSKVFVAPGILKLTQRSRGKINLGGHGRIKNIQMTSRANSAQLFACVSVQNDSGV
jgi:hypothetical protein